MNISGHPDAALPEAARLFRGHAALTGIVSIMVAVGGTTGSLPRHNALIAAGIAALVALTSYLLASNWPKMYGPTEDTQPASPNLDGTTEMDRP